MCFAAGELQETHLNLSKKVKNARKCETFPLRCLASQSIEINSLSNKTVARAL